jgi:FkbM family methyltransferase
MVSNIWTYINGDKTLLVLFPLTEHSVVFDIGGYKGDWASEIFERYHPHICIYEPIKEFYESILNRFDNNPKIEIKDMAAWDECTLLTLGIEKSATGLYCDGPKETVLAIDIFHEIPIHIDLMKINIEGSEYQVLKRIITTNSVYKISNFLIQFHKNVKDHEAQRKIIREYLEQTHELVFDFPYIWEHWRIISYSQARQDVFVLSHYSFSWGSFLDIGCGLPKEINNTYLLEKHGWKGVSIDIKDLNKEWENRETEFIQADALTMNLGDIGLT